MEWSFRAKGLALVLFLLLIYSVVVLVKKKRGTYKVKEYKTGRTIRHAILMIFCIGFSVIPFLIFPEHKSLKTTGEYACKTAAYTWTDESRQETLSKEEEKYPLIVFSHGAFGYIRSNYSLYEELASNGYVVCSISHTYHAFFTKETDGSMKFVNMSFMQEALDATNGIYEMQEEYELTQKWMEVRTGDANFVLDTIETMVEIKPVRKQWLILILQK